MEVRILINGEANEIESLLTNILGRNTITTIPKTYVNPDTIEFKKTWGTINEVNCKGE